MFTLRVSLGGSVVVLRRLIVVDGIEVLRFRTLVQTRQGVGERTTLDLGQEYEEQDISIENTDKRISTPGVYSYGGMLPAYVALTTGLGSGSRSMEQTAF